jgi:transposase InsO family protein
VVDTYSSYAFGFLHTSNQPVAVVAVLHNDVLPFYQEKEIQVIAVLTDNGREFCGTDTHPYEIYLELNDMEFLQDDLDAWLMFYNTDRSHQGYHNMGRRPIDTINLYLDTVREET